MLKFLPALALVVALTPLAANARSNQTPNQGHQYLVNAANAEHVSTIAPGRSGAFHVQAGLVLTDTAPQYAQNNQATNIGG
jgi:hypothetical protein